MPDVPNIHERIRDAVADAIQGVAADLCLRPCDGVYRQNQYDGVQVDLPCVVVSYDVGTEQVRGGTNREDDVAYPVLVGLYVAGPINDAPTGPAADQTPDDPQHAGPTLTKFRDTVRALFLNRDLPAVPDVYTCEIVPQPVVQPKTEGFEQLATAMGVIAVARVPRTPSWSKT